MESSNPFCPARPCRLPDVLMTDTNSMWVLAKVSTVDALAVPVEPERIHQECFTRAEWRKTARPKL